MDLVVEIYDSTSSFPSEEIFGLTSQMRRAAVSVPSNIAEGCARKGLKEKDRFLNYAEGSLSELETQPAIARRLSYFDDGTCSELKKKCSRISAMIRGIQAGMH